MRLILLTLSCLIVKIALSDVGYLPVYLINNIESADNYSTFVDSKGIVWIYSERGVIKYSFKTPVRFTIADGLYRNDVWGMNEDSQGRIWLNYRGKGLRYIKNNEIHSVPEAEKMSELIYSGERFDTAFFYNYDRNKRDMSGRVWYYTRSGKFACYRAKGADEEITSFDNGRVRLIARNGWLWSSVNGKIKNLGLKSDRLIFKHPEWRRFNQAVFPYGKNFQNYDSALVYFKGVFHVINLRKHLGIEIKDIDWQNNGAKVIIDNGKRTYFYTNIWTKERDRQFEHAAYWFYWDYGPHLRINRDQNGNIWINSLRGELCFVPRVYLGMRQYTYTDALKGVILKVSGMAIGGGNKLVFSTMEDGCGIFDMKTRELKLLGNYGNMNELKSNGNISVFNTITAFLVLSPDNSIKKIPKPAGKYIRSFDWLNSSQLILSEGSVYDLQERRIVSKKFVPIRSYSNIGVTKKLILASGITWVDVYSRKTGKLLHRYDNIIASKICVFNGSAFLLLDSGGIMALDENGKKGQVFAKSVIFSDAVCDKDVVYLIDNERVWFVDYYKFKNKGSIGVGVLLNLTMLGGAAKKIAANENYLYLGTTFGIFKLDKKYLESKKDTSIPLEIESVSSREKVIHPDGKSHEFAYYDNNLDIRVTNFNYANFGDISYEYRLLGSNSEWRASKSGEFNFNNIESGDYKLQVRVAGAISPGAMVEFPFRIQTPFWLTWWFRILIVLAVIGMIYLLIYMFFRIRRRFLTQKNELLELEFKALKSQLNPHFIFNSLNSMQSLLFSKDELTANKYIVSLAKLMRTVLNNSRVDKVALHDEVEFLKSYVLIHSVKLDTQLDLVINTDKIDEIRNYAVRTMILQPFVENSIIHGLSPLEGYKRLSLTFEKAGDDYMFVTIEDNGVGRNKAHKTKKNISDQYQSVATSILSEKSILVKRMYKEELQYTYTDLFENGKPAGTRVVIKLKLFPSFTK